MAIPSKYKRDTFENDIVEKVFNGLFEYKCSQLQLNAFLHCCWREGKRHWYMTDQGKSLYNMIKSIKED